jgi:uridine kinase
MHRLLGDAVVIPLESFVRVDSVIDGNFDDISLVEFDLVVKVLSALRAGNEVEVPQV